MARYRGVPTILEKFMEECGKTKCRVTVYELRAYFGLDEFSSQAISGFCAADLLRSFFPLPLPCGTN